MPRRPATVRISTHSLPAAVADIDRYLRRMYLEASDIRSWPFFIPEMGSGTRYIGGGAVAQSIHNRRIYAIQLTSYGTGSGSSIKATVYSGGTASTDKALNVTVTGSGWQRGISYTDNALLNAGKQNLLSTTPWSILVENLGGYSDSTDVTIELFYEDFTPYIDRAV